MWPVYKERVVYDQYYAIAGEIGSQTLIEKLFGCREKEIGSIEYRAVDKMWTIGEGVYGITSKTFSYSYIISITVTNHKLTHNKMKVNGLQEAKHTLCFRGNVNQFVQVCSDGIYFSDGSSVSITDSISCAAIYKQYVIST